MTYDINSNILSKSGLSATQLKTTEKAISPGNGYNDGFFQALVDAENKYAINALFSLAHADIESAHGNSYLAKDRNNLFGFNAIDSDPGQAANYASQAASVDYYASFLKKYYLTDGAVYYNGTTPHGIFVKYSSSHDSEAQSVVGLMNQLGGSTTSGGQSSSSPTPTPTGSDYSVVSGDTLWAIALAHGISLARLLQLNPQITNPDLINPGDVVHVTGGPVVTPAGPANYVTVASGDTLSAYQATYGTSIDTIVGWNKPTYPSMTRDYIQAGWRLRVK